MHAKNLAADRAKILDIPPFAKISHVLSSPILSSLILRGYVLL